MTDGAHLIGHGISSLLYVIRPVVVVAGLLWLLPSALGSLRDVSEIVRYDYTPIPKPLIITVMLLSVALGAMAVIANQIYLLPYFKTLGLPWAAMTAPVLSIIASSLSVICFQALAFSHCRAFNSARSCQKARRACAIALW